MRLSLFASAVLAAALFPVGSASAALAAPATAQAPTAVTVSCRDAVDGLYCGYDLSDAYTDRGDSGAKVMELQALLIYRGYSVGSTGVDGYFGAATESAVSASRLRKGSLPTASSARLPGTGSGAPSNAVSSNACPVVTCRPESIRAARRATCCEGG
ncbi:peptidoglycan-binding domain-containing protein [Streptomyces botrytidirepellens]|uniref:peptidoglycan-binding domain-containing protein n=1 Tax=Streptomyces botrytidirepellens TaxID=2486417 RepID=UPI001FE910E3|nr:peptidoglycan-binding domain-containing protein [Streptomyces botrytidirepellens]